MVHVKWFAPEGLERGKSSDDFELTEGSTISALIKKMVEIYGETARQRLLQEDGVTPYVKFIVGGKLVPYDFCLSSDMEVMVLPPIYGG